MLQTNDSETIQFQNSKRMGEDRYSRWTIEAVYGENTIKKMENDLRIDNLRRIVQRTELNWT